MLTDASDPLADEGAASCTHGCSERWVTVCNDSDGNYLGSDPNDPTYAGIVASTAVYPCPDCAPDLFLQWTDGCFAREHRPCDRCRYRRSNRRDLT